MSARPILGMPVFPVQLLAHLDAYTRTKKVLFALRVCNKSQTTEPDVHITKLPKELVAMIEDAVMQPIRVERMQELAREYNCYIDRCNGPDHFTAEEVLEINEAISSKMGDDLNEPSSWNLKYTSQQFPDLNTEEIRQKVLEKEFDIELMGEIGEEHDRRIQVWEKRWLLPQLQSYSKTLRTSFDVNVMVWVVDVPGAEGRISLPPRKTMTFLTISPKSQGATSRSTTSSPSPSRHFGWRITPLGSNDTWPLKPLLTEKIHFSKTIRLLALHPCLQSLSGDIDLTSQSFDTRQDWNRSRWPQLLVACWEPSD